MVIYAENRIFDNLYGQFSEANGLFKNTGGTSTRLSRFQQVDRDGIKPLATLPAVWDAKGSAAKTLEFVASIPNLLFELMRHQEGFPAG